MSKYIILVSVILLSVSNLSAMPMQSYENQVYDQSAGVVMVGERGECGPLRTSAASLQDDAEYTPSSEMGEDKHHTN